MLLLQEDAEDEDQEMEAAAEEELIPDDRAITDPNYRINIWHNTVLGMLFICLLHLH